MPLRSAVLFLSLRSHSVRIGDVDHGARQLFRDPVAEASYLTLPLPDQEVGWRGKARGQASAHFRAEVTANTLVRASCGSPGPNGDLSRVPSGLAPDARWSRRDAPVATPVGAHQYRYREC